ncbi:MAG: pentapeptide repeat-containing protein [Pirellulaceae bacterium]|nr:pentapeptide repeat-containing protein [Pirellulaceae bacterium]
MDHSDIGRRIDATALRTGRLPTDMTKAILIGADLRGVDLRQVRGLTWEQLRTAVLDPGTRLPLGLRLMWAIERFVERISLRR